MKDRTSLRVFEVSCIYLVPNRTTTVHPFISFIHSFTLTSILCSAVFPKKRKGRKKNMYHVLRNSRLEVEVAVAVLKHGDKERKGEEGEEEIF